jgi:hypothetical protein
MVGLREKPSLPLREAKFVVKLASDEAHQNRFRRPNRSGPSGPGLGTGAQSGMRGMVPEGAEG